MFSRFPMKNINAKRKTSDKGKRRLLFQIEHAVGGGFKELNSQKLQMEETQHFFGLEKEKQKRFSMGLCAGALILAVFLQQMTEDRVQSAYAHQT